MATLFISDDVWSSAEMIGSPDGSRHHPHLGLVELQINSGAQSQEPGDLG